MQRGAARLFESRFPRSVPGQTSAVQKKMHNVTRGLPGPGRSWFRPPVKKEAVIFGMGQLGSVFAEGFSRLGFQIVARRRGQPWPKESLDPEVIVVATGEDDLPDVLSRIPQHLQSRVVLLQNELRPDQWQRHLEVEPTVAIIWFEKKGDRPPVVVLESQIAGPLAELIRDCLHANDLSSQVVTGKDALAHALVLKNLYILCLNFAGLSGAKSAGELLGEKRSVFEALFSEVFQMESALFRTARGHISEVLLDQARLHQDLEQAILADPDHGCAGRTAPLRLARTVGHIERLKLFAPTLRALKENVS